MSDMIDVAEARELPGLRLVTVVGIPSPWGEAVKGIFHVKKLEYVRVRQMPGGPNEDLVAWTGQNSAPAAAWNDEAPRTGWAEILLLAERLAPEPRLVPAAPEERALHFGLANELMGELGFGWCRRAGGIHRGLQSAPPGPARDASLAFGAKYGYRPEEGDLYARRVREILELFSARLRAQHEAGSRYLLGDALTALDVYWAAMAALVEPLPEAQCAMGGGMRAFYTLSDRGQRARGDEILLAHRDFIYQTHLQLPLKLT